VRDEPAVVGDGGGGVAATGATGGGGAAGGATVGTVGGVTTGTSTFDSVAAIGLGLLALLPGGQVKSSARPAGASIGLPLTSTCAARLSPCTGVPAPPASASALLGGTVNGTTGPASGRAADLPPPGTGASGPAGNPTRPRLFM
jgi:hypothetical protein